ncbi:3-isopropylmalate dehydratase [Coniophora puteana RWD-64-598 SS2]|uniref:3-isopropylmalate dehydratase n=1 Tax=Coniophora puteana (strain RWD-64-598) TaxID=741705 RepID=A0A5M3MMS9_CONPW|nr:3-isopropylmalate dehydratase [Coniophora puteana RWD-64-598 SS2]EIW79911.1 3-isopropylmalate dehydratase [Coniophora puteana RWD-64-598 SS2]
MSSSSTPRTLYDKIWDDHVVHDKGGGLALIYIDRHLVHEVSSPQAFEGLRDTGRRLRRPDCTLATVDHNVPTAPREEHLGLDSLVPEPESRAQCAALDKNVKDFGLAYFGIKDRRQGIVHVIGPEQGFTLPGITCVCGDSHTSTHGAFGALAFGIGTSEVEHVFATQTLWQRKSKNMRINVEGTLAEGVTSKDVILHIIGQIGTAGASGCVIEYAGTVIRSLSMEARMSICNMSIEAGARAGMIAPDDVTFSYLKGRPLAPKGEVWDKAEAYWRSIASDEGANFDIEITIDGASISPTVTWGTSPQHVAPITGVVPDPATMEDPARRESAERALKYMGLEPGTRMQDIAIDKVFIGSCTNSRIEDLRSAAKVLAAAGENARVAPNLLAMVVPGSGLIKQQAEAEGIAAAFQRAGFQWREAGCSMCVGMNADQLDPGKRCASTSNRNFEGRQGPGGRTHLMSPAMATAVALTGKLTDVRSFTLPGAEAGAAPLSVSFEQQTGANASKTAIRVHHDAPIPSWPAPESESAQEDSADGAQKSTGSTPMEPFVVLRGLAAPMHLSNTDTDQIIPKQFCKTLKRTGLAKGLFYYQRQHPGVEPEPGVTFPSEPFVLDTEPYTRAKIIVSTGVNFGCGSSREHAVWSFKDFGIRCIIAPSFGEIFFNNMMQNGMLAIVLPQDACRMLAGDAEQGLELEVDLGKQEVRRVGRADGTAAVSFATEASRRDMLLTGVDEIGQTLQLEEHIDVFEQKRAGSQPWLGGFKKKRVDIPTSASSGSTDW